MRINKSKALTKHGIAKIGGVLRRQVCGSRHICGKEDINNKSAEIIAWGCRQGFCILCVFSTLSINEKADSSLLLGNNKNSSFKTNL